MAADLPIVARVIDKTKPGLRSAGDGVDKLGKKTSAFGKIAKGAALGVAGIAAAGIAVGVKLAADFLTAADAIGKMSTATGVGIEELQELDFALQQGGSSIKTFEKGILTWQKGLFDAAEKGTGPVKEGLEKLGIEIETIQGLKPDEQFRLIAEAISEVKSPTDQAALAQKLFGGAGKELLPTLKAGSEALDTLTAEARDNGAIMSTDTVKGAEAVNDAMNSAKEALRGLATKGFSFVLPHIKTAVDWFKNQVVPVIKNDVIPRVSAFVTLLRDKLAPIIRDDVIPRIKALVTVFRDSVEPIIVNNIIPAIKRITALFGNGGGTDGEGLKKALDLLQKAFELVMPIVSTVLGLHVGIIITAVELLITSIASIITFIDATFKGDWETAWAEVEKVFQTFVDNFVDSWQVSFDGVELAAGFFWGHLVDGTKLFVNDMIALVEAVPNAFITGINAVIRAWNGLRLTIPGFSKNILGKEVVLFKGFSLETPNVNTIAHVQLPRLASGGI